MRRSGEVQHSLRGVEREFISALARDVTASNIDSATICRLTKELEGGPKSLDSSVGNVNGKHLIHDDE